VKDDIRRL
ncbi:unnamed protein product, partial [Onchocerca ochengi]